jgi:hypothetical protein
VKEPIPIDAEHLKEFLKLHGITREVKEAIVEFCPPEFNDPKVLKKFPELIKLKGVKVKFKPLEGLTFPTKPLSKSETPTALLLEELFIHYPSFAIIAGSACDLPIMLFRHVNEKLKEGADPKRVIIDWFFDFIYTKPQDVITKISELSRRKDVHIVTKIVSKSFDKCEARNVYYLVDNDISWIDPENGIISIKMMGKSKPYTEVEREIPEILRDKKVILYLGIGLRYFEKIFHTFLPHGSLVVYCDVTDKGDILEDFGREKTLHVIKVLDRLEDIFYTFDLAHII